MDSAEIELFIAVAKCCFKLQLYRLCHHAQHHKLMQIPLFKYLLHHVITQQYQYFTNKFKNLNLS